MAISTNTKPTIYRNVYEYTGPERVEVDLHPLCSPAMLGPSSAPMPSPTLNKLNSAGTSCLCITSEHDEYIAAMIGPPNSPNARNTQT